MKVEDLMYKIKLMNEFLHGPIWIYDHDGRIPSQLAFYISPVTHLNPASHCYP